jgi:hypothetical protein
MRFTLEIDLGNSFMRTAEHVAMALVQVSKRMPMLVNFEDFESSENGEAELKNIKVNIRDVNGSTVGFWKIEK